MFGLSMTELIMVLVVALLVIGPKQLPQVAKTLGKAMRDFRRASDDLRDTFEREVMEETKPEIRQDPASVATSPARLSGRQSQEPASAESQAIPHPLNDDRRRALTANAPPEPLEPEEPGVSGSSTDSSGGAAGAASGEPAKPGVSRESGVVSSEMAEKSPGIADAHLPPERRSATSSASASSGSKAAQPSSSNTKVPSGSDSEIRSDSDSKAAQSAPGAEAGVSQKRAPDEAGEESA